MQDITEGTGSHLIVGKSPKTAFLDGGITTLVTKKKKPIYNKGFWRDYQTRYMKDKELTYVTKERAKLSQGYSTKEEVFGVLYSFHGVFC